MNCALRNVSQQQHTSTTEGARPHPVRESTKSGKDSKSAGFNRDKDAVDIAS
jgi:hypothetical protein